MQAEGGLRLVGGELEGLTAEVAGGVGQLGAFELGERLGGLDREALLHGDAHQALGFVGQFENFVRDFAGYVVYLGEKNGATLKDFWLWRLDDQKRVTQVVHAQSGRIDYDETTNELIVTLTQAHAETRDPKNPENFALAQPDEPTQIIKTEWVKMAQAGAQQYLDEQKKKEAAAK